MASSSPAISIAASTPRPRGRVEKQLALRAALHERRHGAQATGGLHPVGQPIGGHDRRRARHARQLDQQEPDRPAAEHADRVAGPDAPQAECVDPHAERLQHCARGVVDRVRQRHGVSRGPGQQLAQRPVGHGVAQEPHPWAQVAAPGRARLARAAGDLRVEGNPLACPRSVDDHARRLVAEDQRPGEDGVADPGFVVPVQVGAADPHGRHPDQDLVRPRDGGRLVGQAEVADAVEAERPHRPASPAAAASAAAAAPRRRRAARPPPRGSSIRPGARPRRPGGAPPAPPAGPCPARGGPGRRRSCRRTCAPRPPRAPPGRPPCR